MNFNKGDSVLARAPGQRGYSKGVVRSIDAEGKYQVEFQGGIEIKVNEKNIKQSASTEKRAPSPGRRPKSPARKPKSPVRRTASPTKRSNSPGRRPNSPGRRPQSPARLAKTIASIEKSESSLIKRPVRVKAAPRKEQSPTNVSSSRVDKSFDRKPVVLVEQSSSYSRSYLSQNDSQTESDTDDLPVFPRRKGRSRNVSEDEKQTARVSPLNNLNGVIERIGSVGVLTRRGLRSSQSKDKEQPYQFQEKIIDPIYKINEFSDNDDIVFVDDLKKKSPSPVPAFQRSIYTSKEFGGTIGTIVLTILALFVPVLLQIWCSKGTYTNPPNLTDLKKLALGYKNYFNLHVVLGYIGIYVLYAILSVIPFGGPFIEGPLSKYGKIKFRANGLFSFVVTTAILFGFEYKKMGVFNLIFQKQFQFFITSGVAGLLLAVLLNIRSYFMPLASLNVQGTTGTWFYNFFVGREVMPKIGGIFDVKSLLIRASSQITILVLLAYLIRGFGSSNVAPFDLNTESLKINPTLIAICLTQIIFVLVDAFALEHAFLNTFENQQEGCGLLTCLRYSMKPFMVTLLAKYVLEHNIQQPLWVIALASTLFIVGLIIYGGSNAQKHNFRQNPFNPALAHLETIPTPLGKKLLVSGYWGIVRHPNYVGHLIINAAWFAMAPTAPVALITLPLCFIFLIHRSIRDNARCQQKYGAAWDKYCERVKYVLIPKVY